MLINKRNAMLAGKRLPYDAEVEYLQSDGNAYINTGVIGTDRLIIDSVWSYAAPNAYAAPFGARASAASNALAITGHDVTIDNRLYMNYGTAAGWLTVLNVTSYGYNWAVHVENGNCQIFRDDVLVNKNRNTQTTFSTLVPMIIFGFVNSTTANSLIARDLRMYSWSAKEGNISLRDLIPVRFTNENGVSEGAMFDRANPTVGMNPDGSARTDGLYRNRGTGAFIIGPDASAANGGGYKLRCTRRSYRRSSRPSARFFQPRLWKEVA